VAQEESVDGAYAVKTMQIALNCEHEFVLVRAYSIPGAGHLFRYVTNQPP